MNIAILSYHRVGGSGIVAYEIGRAMAEERGHKVHFIGLEPPFRLKTNLNGSMSFHKVYVKEYPVFDFQPYSLALASQLAEIIEEHWIDVVHSHYALPHAVSAILAREISKKKVKCVTTLHGTDITVVGAHPTMKNITRYAIENSDVVTAVSESLKKDTIETFGVSKHKIKCIYNFINREHFNPELGMDSSEKRGKKILMHVSNLRPVKMPLDVIKIFEKVHAGFKGETELWVIGEGPMKFEMISLAEKLKIRKNVRFMGICSSLGSMIASSDLMLVPSQKESFGLSALEAMASGVPVIASRVGGLPEVVDDGVSGYLFDLGDVNEAANKCLQLLNDPGLYEELSKGAIRSAAEKFSMEKMIDRYEEAYRN